jgi:adenylyltransferase/sulfurtransferase
LQPRRNGALSKMLLTPSQPGTQDNPPDERYSRQILFPGVGRDGQQKLAQARVAIVGVGATGAASASLLARAGVGHLTLIDRDVVEPSNLQRQVLFDERDAEASAPKAEAAKTKIGLFNSAIRVEARVSDLVPGNIEELLGQAHLLLDCTDNFETRYLLNDYAVSRAKPWIYAAAIGAYAATMNILPGGAFPVETVASTACLACLFPVPPAGAAETCETAGILGSAVNMAASLQITEALKLLTGQPQLMRRTLLSWDLWTNQHAEVAASSPARDCAVCGLRQFTHLAGTARPHITLCGRNAVQIHEHHRPLSLTALYERLRLNPEIEGLRANAMLLRFRRGLHQITIFPDGRALVQGTTDPAAARSLYARFIGS